MTRLAVHRCARFSMLTREETDAAYNPVPDRLLSSLLGTTVRVYRRGPGHMEFGYADPESNPPSVNLAASQYQLVYQLATGFGPPTAAKARAAYVLAHELGHLNAHDPHSEDQANAWAALHYPGVLKKLRVGLHERKRLYRSARNQGLC